MRHSAAPCAFLLVFVGIAAVCNGAPIYAIVRHDSHTRHDPTAHVSSPETAPENSSEMAMGNMPMEDAGAQDDDGANMAGSDMGSMEDDSPQDDDGAMMTESDMDSEEGSGAQDGDNNQITEAGMGSEPHREHGSSAAMTESDMGSTDATNSDDNEGKDGMEVSESGMPSGMEMSESGMDSEDHSSDEHGSDDGDKPTGEKPSGEEGNHTHKPDDEMEASTDEDSMNSESTSTMMEASEEPEASPAAESGVCIGANMLQNFAAHDLVFEKHVLARVLCDASGSCATKGHIVNYKGKGMMMASYCNIVGCKENIMEVNSPKYRRGLKIESKSENMQFTAFAAKYETRTEEAVLSAAVHMGL